MRNALAAVVLWGAAGGLQAQVVNAPPAPADWRAGSPGVVAAAATSPAAGFDPAHRTPVRVTAGNGTLPNEQGQIWREYDISPYTSRVANTRRPEQAMVDWILRETGYEVWHSQPLAILSATPQTLRVYHTPQMQAVVADLVERFLASASEVPALSLRLITVESPNWRAKAQRLLRPVPIHTPGASAWLLPKEAAAILLADLQRRLDYHELTSPRLLVSNGQSTVISSTRARSYVRDVLPRRDNWQGFENVGGQIDEGFSLEFSPLLSADRRSIDAAIKCQIDQVEQLLPVYMELATAISPRQRAKIDVPQLTHFQFQERFRWPVDQVLLIELGMVPMPMPIDGRPAGGGLAILASPPRADVLVLVESKDTAPRGP